MKRKIVCLCGSTRFREEFERANREETLKGNIVLTVGAFVHEDNLELETKVDLDRLHKDKIDIADEVLILNVGKYVGLSTLSEFLHAYRNGKSIRFLHPLTKAEFQALLVRAVGKSLPPQEVPAANTLVFGDIAVMHEMFWGAEIRAKVAEMPKAMKTELLNFRLKFIEEEYRESLAAKTGEEFVDGLIDMTVVIIGTLYLFGVDGEKAWNEVQRANCAKEVGVKANRPNPFGFPDLIKPPGWVAPDHRGNVGVLSEVFGNPVTEDKRCDTTGTTDCTKNLSAG